MVDSNRLRALVPEIPWPEGRLVLAGSACGFRTLRVAEGLSELLFESEGPALDPEAVAAWAEQAGCPVLGDTGRGGLSVPGGRRLVPGGQAPPAGFWPEAPVFAPDARAADGGRVLRISRGSLRALSRGHPWVLADDETGDVRMHRPGALVRLAGRRGPTVALARVDDARPVAARLWASGDVRPREAPSVEARVARSLARRSQLGQGSGALRLVHGEADGLPGLHVDRLGDLLRVLVTGRAALPIVERVIDAVALQQRREEGGALPVVLVMHLRETPPGALVCSRTLRGDADLSARLVVDEAGLRFLVAPGHDEPHRSRPGIGLFLDQREGRALVRARARPGARYLNLFAHTGAYSAVLLQAGAGEVTSVDLSPSYLAWLEDNLVASGLDRTRHRSVRRDVRRFLEAEAGAGPYAGIVLDPPTAAAAGRRFFSARRELPELVAACLARLEPGGWLLVSRHDRRHRGRLEALVREAAAGRSVRFERLPAPPDFPSLAGFPEGDPFEGLLAAVS